MLPRSYYVSRAEVLRESGISSSQLDKMIGARVLDRVVLPGCKYGKYIRSQVMRAFNLKETESGK